MKTIVMKKFILALCAVFAVSAGAFAMNLKEAFEALSDIPNINVKAPDYNLPVVMDGIRNGRVAAAYNLNEAQIAESGAAAFTLLNRVPLARMINGANNGMVAAFVYAEPDGNGANDVLIAVMSGYRGSVVFIYGTIDDVIRDAIQNADLEMEGNYRVSGFSRWVGICRSIVLSLQNETRPTAQSNPTGSPDRQLRH